MSSSLLESTRRNWGAQSPKPVIRLVHLFAGRISHGGEDGGDSGVGVAMGLVLSLLALPGGFYSLFLIEKYSTLLQWMRGVRNFDPLAGALPDEYFFIVLSMVVTGVVAVWRWDSVFPDRRDYSNLVPLPIATRTIFVANLAAIVATALILALDVNAISAILFPFVVSASAGTFGFFIRFVGVHIFVVVLASVFSFFSVFAVVGALMVTLPYALFRRASLYLRAAILAALIAMLSTSFAIPAMLAKLPQTSARFLPSVWFLGLCQLIRGKATAPLAALGREALISSGLAVAAAVAIYALSYRRCFVRIPEASEIRTTSTGRRSSLIFSALDRTILTSPSQRAGYRFVMKTLARSEQHGLMVGGFAGLGIVIASQFLFASLDGRAVTASAVPSSEILAIPLILSYCVIIGLWIAFDVPTDLRANWIFRLALDTRGQDCVPLARKVILTFVFPWLLAVVLPVYGYLWGWNVAAFHTLVVLMWSLLFTEILLLRFHKLPFTCSYPQFRESAGVLLLLYVLGFVVFVVMTSELEHLALTRRVFLLAFVAVPLIAGYILARLRGEVSEIDKQLVFEDRARASFDLIDLKRGS